MQNTGLWEQSWLFLLLKYFANLIVISIHQMEFSPVSFMFPCVWLWLSGNIQIRIFFSIIHILSSQFWRRPRGCMWSTRQGRRGQAVLSRIIQTFRIDQIVFDMHYLFDFYPSWQHFDRVGGLACGRRPQYLGDLHQGQGGGGGEGGD